MLFFPTSSTGIMTPVDLVQKSVLHVTPVHVYTKAAVGTPWLSFLFAS